MAGTYFAYMTYDTVTGDKSLFFYAIDDSGVVGAQIGAPLVFPVGTGPNGQLGSVMFTPDGAGVIVYDDAAQSVRAFAWSLAGVGAEYPAPPAPTFMIGSFGGVAGLLQVSRQIVLAYGSDSLGNMYIVGYTWTAGSGLTHAFTNAPPGFDYANFHTDPTSVAIADYAGFFGSVVFLFPGGADQAKGWIYDQSDISPTWNVSYPTPAFWATLTPFGNVSIEFYNKSLLPNITVYNALVVTYVDHAGNADRLSTAFYWLAPLDGAQGWKAQTGPWTVLAGGGSYMATYLVGAHVVLDKQDFSTPCRVRWLNPLTGTLGASTDIITDPAHDELPQRIYGNGIGSFLALADSVNVRSFLYSQAGKTLGAENAPWPIVVAVGSDFLTFPPNLFFLPTGDIVPSPIVPTIPFIPPPIAVSANNFQQTYMPTVRRGTRFIIKQD
jgi:hypothetical protein